MKKPFYKKAWFLFLMVFLAIGILGSQGDDSKKEDPVVSSTVQTQAEAQPVAEVPTPAPAPAPTPIPDPELSSEETAYISEMVDISFDLSDYMRDFSELMGSPKLNDQQWIFDTVFAITMVTQKSNEMKDIVVPEKFKTIHKEYIDNGINYLIKGMDMIPAAIDNLDADALGEVVDYIGKFNDATTIYTEKFTTLMN